MTSRIRVSMTIRAAFGVALALACAAPGCAAAPGDPAPALSASAPAQPALASNAALAPVAFLAGSWFVEKGGERIEEQWSIPAGGMMLATGRTLRGGNTVLFEYLRIESTPSGVVYIAQPRGKDATTFKLAQAAEGKVVFENPAHDFPKRISYTRRSEGTIDVRIEGESDGKPASDAWVLSPDGQGRIPERDRATDEAAVIQGAHDACKAYLDGDPERLAEVLTEDFTLTDASGDVTTRADDIENAKKGTIRYEVFENHDMKVRLHGDTAVVTGRTKVKGKAGDKAFAVEFQFTDTLVRHGKRWRFAASHVSRIPARP